MATASFLNSLWSRRLSKASVALISAHQHLHCPKPPRISQEQMCQTLVCAAEPTGIVFLQKEKKETYLHKLLQKLDAF